jgi:hypothetical protein
MTKSRWVETRQQHGKPCAYCRREMDADSDQLRPTRDHVIPISHLRRHGSGLGPIVWACYVCNAIKADRTPAEWDAYMAANPEWWKGSLLRCPNYRRRYRRKLTAPYPLNQRQPWPWLDELLAWSEANSTPEVRAYRRQWSPPPAGIPDVE